MKTPLFLVFFFLLFTATAFAQFKSDGQFYKTMDDYLNDKPIPGIKITNASYYYLVFGGYEVTVVDDTGNSRKENGKNFPGEIFTYKRDDDVAPYIMRTIDKKQYIILAMGKVNYYALYDDQLKRFTAEGWNGKLKRFVTSDFEKKLKQYDLLAQFKKDKPKREFKDDVNDYFNKIVDWQIAYFNLLNMKM